MAEESENWLSEVDSQSIAIPTTGYPRIRMAGKGGQAKATKEIGGHVGHGRHGERVRAISAPGLSRCAQCGQHSSLLRNTGILGDRHVTDTMVFVFYGSMTEDGAREGFRGKNDRGRIEGGFFPPFPHPSGGGTDQRRARHAHDCSIECPPLASVQGGDGYIDLDTPVLLAISRQIAAGGRGGTPCVHSVFALSRWRKR
jgi:hypothetical protein